MLFDVYDLDFGSMTLTLKLDLDMMVTYVHAKNEVNRLKGSKVMAWNCPQTDRQIDKQVHIVNSNTSIFFNLVSILLIRLIGKISKITLSGLHSIDELREKLFSIRYVCAISIL